MSKEQIKGHIKENIKENIQDIREVNKEVKEVKKEVKQTVHCEIEGAKQKEKESLWEGVKALFNIHEDVADHDEIRKRIIDGGKFTGTNMCVLILAILIASVGLNTNSTAVIIGAMLISPLMGSILATAYGTIAADVKVAAVHEIGFIIQVIISICTATVYFLLSPLKAETAELIARTQPTFYDVIIAIAGGLAGIIGQTRKDKSNNIIPGVAIATALMPPLCTCGYAIANMKFHMLFGAFYLFVVNSYFIFCAAAIILSFLKIPKVREVNEQQWKRLKKLMIRNAILIMIPSIIFGAIMILNQ